jgi:glycosyltransferase involved in cell wall biosynthesis
MPLSKCPKIRFVKRLGLIARADNGGLGALTWEFARHLQPDRVLIMDLGGGGRSVNHLDRYDGLDYRVCHSDRMPRDDADWLLDGCDVLYSGETWYGAAIPERAADAGVHTVLHSMPELHNAMCRADDIWVPTSYRKKLIHGAKQVPVPVALDRFVYRRREAAEHFVHVWGPAMLDRNGTNTVLASVEMVRLPTRVTVVGAQGRVVLPDTHPVTLDCLPRGYPKDYFDIWPEDADVLLLPRRYAGLSLPVQEAAAQGIPAVMTNVEPQCEWPGVCHVPSRGRPKRVPMAGGIVDVWDPDPGSLALLIERLVQDPKLVGEMSDRARHWAETMSWDAWADRYRALLGLYD